MKKYRVSATANGWTIEKRFLFFFWIWDDYKTSKDKQYMQAIVDKLNGRACRFAYVEEKA